uniref:U36-Sparatoxin-Hju1a_1 n=1 Tax=Heteropoda jugulans TaxID=1358901 RepID=A0A4Q8K8L6_9ARAC
MKLTMVMMLFSIAFSAVALAERAIENAALDNLVSRNFRCSGPNESCHAFTTLKCCPYLECKYSRCVRYKGRK